MGLSPRVSDIALPGVLEVQECQAALCGREWVMTISGLQDRMSELLSGSIVLAHYNIFILLINTNTMIYI